jgi:hypothetical protein
MEAKFYRLQVLKYFKPYPAILKTLRRIALKKLKYFSGRLRFEC